MSGQAQWAPEPAGAAEQPRPCYRPHRRRQPHQQRQQQQQQLRQQLKQQLKQQLQCRWRQWRPWPEQQQAAGALRERTGKCSLGVRTQALLLLSRLGHGGQHPSRQALKVTVMPPMPMHERERCSVLRRATLAEPLTPWKRVTLQRRRQGLTSPRAPHHRHRRERPLQRQQQTQPHGAAQQKQQ